MNKYKARLQETYLDYLNNFLTVERFSEYYEITSEQGELLIELGRSIHEDYVQQIKDLGL